MNYFTFAYMSFFIALGCLIGWNFWAIVAWIVSRPPVANWLITRAMKTPYLHIADKNGQPYMERYWLFNPYQWGKQDKERSKHPWCPINIRIHWIRRADADQHLHDHPWNARTIILRGGYAEKRLVRDVPQEMRGLIADEHKTFTRRAGDTATLRFGEYHRITMVQPGGAWTLFISGPYQGTWGFLVDGVKVKWREYLGLEK